jgi:hypothetical protein
MNVDQSTRIAVAFAREAARSANARLCAACVEVLLVDGAGITLMGDRQAGPVCVSNARMAVLEDLQFMIGEGPCQDAFRSGLPVHAPRLDDAATSRWPSFAALANRSGIGAVFAYPMASHGSRVGVLTLYQDHGGGLTDAQQSDALAVVEVLTEAVLSMQDDAAPGTLGVGLEEAVAHRAEVHQATGMVAVQLQVSVADALLRIRAHAFTAGRPVVGVAADVVSGRLRLVDDRLNTRFDEETV